MKAYSHTAIEFDGRTFGPGVFDATDGEFSALMLRGPARPATVEEIESAPECAAIARDTEQATARRSARPRREATLA